MEEYVAFVSIGSEYRIARTVHLCRCGSKILAGQRYERTVVKVDGQLEVTKVGDHIHRFEEEEVAFNRQHNWF